MLDQYLELGFRLMPCWPRSKRGALRHDQASSDPEVVRAWARGDLVGSPTRRRWYAWRWHHKACNWAVVCGPRSGILVIDVDGGHDELRRIRRQRGLPVAPMAMSGGCKAGYHLYLAYPDRSDLRGHLQLDHRIEIRGDRHLVLLPPSRHDKTGWLYRWQVGRAPWVLPIPEAPAWVAEAMTMPARPERKAVDLTTVGDRYIAAALAIASAEVAGTANGQRNHTLNRATYGLARLIGRVEEQTIRETMLAAALQAGLEASEAQATIGSAIHARQRKAS